jgi:hypothetical protein
MASRRVLFLRTFKNDDTNFVIVNSLALALDATDRIEVVGDTRDRELATEHWQKAFGQHSRPESHIDFIVSTRTDWRRKIMERIHEADAIVLFISPKDLDFPEFSFSPSRTEFGGASDWERFMDEPMTHPLTGQGLLQEISYLNRLQRLPHTVVVCDAKFQPTLDDLIVLGGMIGYAVDLAGNLITPKLTATDKQVGHLRKAFRGITYQRPDPHRPTMPLLADAIRDALTDMAAAGSTRHQPPWKLEDLAGASPEPRRLPPDNELKIIAFSDVEKVFFIPSGEIIQLDELEMRHILNRTAVRTGCPYCRAPMEKMFFYTRGLTRLGLGNASGENDWPNAKCQVCGSKSSLFGEDMLAPQ